MFYRPTLDFSVWPSTPTAASPSTQRASSPNTEEREGWRCPLTCSQSQTTPTSSWCKVQCFTLHHTECKNGAKMHFIFFLKTCDNKNNATALRNVRFIVTEFLSIVCFFNRIPFHCFQIVKTSLCLSRKYAI